jgi:CBS-domain-containing membrane protein
MQSYLFSALRREIARIRTEFNGLWRNYIYQTLMASVLVFLVLILLEMQHAVVIASIGASVFLVFAMPHNVTAQPRRIIGGYLIGLVTGSLSAMIPQGSLYQSFVVYAVAIGVSMFLMVALDVEHPPASGIALGTAMTGFSPRLGVAIIISCIALTAAHYFVKRFFKDLT